MHTRKIQETNDWVNLRLILIFWAVLRTIRKPQRTNHLMSCGVTSDRTLCAPAASLRRKRRVGSVPGNSTGIIEFSRRSPVPPCSFFCRAGIFATEARRRRQ